MEDTEKATDRLIKMVNDFLNVSRLDQGRLKVEIKTLDGCQAVANVVKELMPLAEEKKIKLTGRSDGATGEEYARYVIDTIRDPDLENKWKSYQG